MRAFSFFVFLFSAHVFAQSFDEKLKALSEAQDKEVFQLGVDTQFGGKYPNEKYVQEFAKLQERQLAARLKLHDDECAATKRCLSATERKVLETQSRIASGLVQRKNQWTIEGLSAAEKKKKEEEYKRETDREIATANGGSVPKPDTGANGGTPNGNPKPKPDTGANGGTPNGNPKPKPDTGANGGTPNGKPKPDTGANGGAVVVTPNGTTSGSNGGTTVTPNPDTSTSTKTPSAAEAERSAKQEEINKALKVFEDEYKKYEGKDVTQEHVDAYQKLEKAKLDMTVAMYKILCEKYPKEPGMCLDSAMIEAMQDGVESNNCLIERKHQIHVATDKSKVRKVEELSNHFEQWKANNKDCKKLLASDILPATGSETPTTTEVAETDQESEDKRNYKSAECKWVVNMPRKVVTGVSCGKSKNNICVGYVSCPRKTGPGIFTRMSTCRASYCGNEDAVKCTQDPGYWSRKPTGEDKEYVSPEVKRVLKTSRQ